MIIWIDLKQRYLVDLKTGCFGSSATFAGPLEKLSPGKSALFADHSLSEPLRGEFELSVNAFSRFSGA